MIWIIHICLNENFHEQNFSTHIWIYLIVVWIWFPDANKSKLLSCSTLVITEDGSVGRRAQFFLIWNCCNWHVLTSSFWSYILAIIQFPTKVTAGKISAWYHLAINKRKRKLHPYQNNKNKQKGSSSALTRNRLFVPFLGIILITVMRPGTCLLVTWLEEIATRGSAIR